MRLIDGDALYERVCELEAQALSYVGKIVNDESKMEERKIWSAILAERTAFKYDVYDAPTIEERNKGSWTDDNACPFCGFQPWYERDIHTLSYCPNCGADMRGERNE